MRKILCFILTMLLVFACLPGVLANSEITVTLDDTKIEFDVPPQIINSRTMVPLRAVFEAIGANVDWNDATKTVTSVKGDKKIELIIDSDTMYVNDEAVTVDSPACIVENRTLVPVRVISESFGLNVEWVEETRTVKITKPAPTNTLSVVKESSHKNLRTVHPGDDLTYTFTVVNDTAEAKQFEITDKVPEYTTYKNGDATVNENSLSFNISVAAGETENVSYTVTVTDDLEKRGTPIVSDSAEYLGNKIPCDDVYIGVTLNEYDMQKVAQAMHAVRNSKIEGKNLLAYYFRIAFSLDNAIGENAPDVAKALFVDSALENSEKYASIVIPDLYGGKKIDDSHKTRFKGDVTEKVSSKDVFPGDVVLVVPSVNDISGAKMYATDGINYFDITGKMTKTESKIVFSSVSDADYFAVLRPISRTSSIAFIRSDAPYEGETDVEKAIIATAKAFLLRGFNMQYSDIHLAKGLTRWERGKSPEDYTTDETGYTNCTGYMHDIYYNALGWDYGNHALYDSPESWFVFDYNLTGSETEEEINAVKEKFMNAIKPGDIVYYRYSGNNHGMLYVGNGDLMHSTGSTYKYDTGKESEEATIRYQKLITLFTPGNSRYIFQTDKPRSRFFILRPTNDWKGEIPESTLARIENMKGIVAEKTASITMGQTINKGENLTYTFSIYNANSYPVTLDVKDVIPEGTTLFEEGSLSDKKSLSLKVDVAPGEEKKISYTVRVNEDVADDFVILSSDESKVGGVSVKCPPMFVGRTLTEEEQNKLLAALDAYKAENTRKSGLRLADKLYKDAFGVDVFGCSFEELKTALFIPNETNRNLATEGKFVDMIAPTLFGGHKVLDAGFLGERTRFPREKNLIIGDILYLQNPSEEESYMYIGNGKFIDMKTSDECDAFGCLEVAMSWEQFVILRPSLVFED